MESDSLWRRWKPKESRRKKRLKSNTIYSSELYNHIICCEIKPDYDHFSTEPASLAAVSDDLTFSLLDTRLVFCMINSNRKRSTCSDSGDVEEAHGCRCNTGTGVLRRFYEE